VYQWEQKLFDESTAVFEALKRQIRFRLSQLLVRKFSCRTKSNQLMLERTRFLVGELKKVRIR
jgi:hypothetical protein